VVPEALYINTLLSFPFLYPGRQKDTQTDILITVLRNRPAGQVIKFFTDIDIACDVSHWKLLKVGVPNVNLHALQGLLDECQCELFECRAFAPEYTGCIIVFHHNGSILTLQSINEEKEKLVKLNVNLPCYGH